MTYDYFNEMPYMWLKVWGHPKKAVAVHGRVGLEECSLDLFFNQTCHWFGADFFQQLKLDIFRHISESIYFLTIKSIFYNCY